MAAMSMGRRVLEGRTALVTGAGRGVGKGIALALGQAGCSVAVNYVELPEQAEATATELRAVGVDAFTVRADVGAPAEVTTMLDRVVTRFGHLDALVNNAGIQTWGPLIDVDPEDWDRVLRTNLTGCFLCTQAAARHMRTQGGGAIVNIGSGSNKLPFKRLVAYTASKGGIEMFTKVAAVELGPYGIRVNCVAPGAIEVERTREEDPEYGKTWGSVTPLGRVGTPADVGAMVVSLVSDAGAFVTGQTIGVDGGLFSQPTWPYRGDAG
jgi:NAD(P)-dependent dehydrogenase (short-subunit alcohol dehydrogenase family)